MYTTVPVLKLAYLLISILMTLYTFLWCMGIRPSTSDSSSLFICFLLFWFLQLYMAYRNSRWNSRLKKSFLPFLCWRSSYSAECIFRDSWSFCRPGVYICHTSLLRCEFSLFTVIHKSNESQCTQLITSLRSVRIVLCNDCKWGHRGRGFESRYRRYS